MKTKILAIVWILALVIMGAECESNTLFIIKSIVCAAILAAPAIPYIKRDIR